MKKQDTRLHYKMYKSGKQWVFASLATVIMGTSATTMTTHADNDISSNSDTNKTLNEDKVIDNSQSNSNDNSSIEVAQQVNISSNPIDTPSKDSDNQATTLVSNENQNNVTAVTETDDQGQETTVNDNDAQNQKDDSVVKNTLISDQNSDEQLNSNLTPLNENSTTPIFTENSNEWNQVTNESQLDSNSVANNNDQTTNSFESSSLQESDLNSTDVPSDNLKDSTPTAMDITNTDVSAEDPKNRNLILVVEQNATDALTGTWGTVDWSYDNESNKLSLNTSGILGMRDEDGSPFIDPEIVKNIKEIDVNAQMKLPSDSTNLFTSLPVLTTINGLDKLDASDVTNMNAMFYNDDMITTLDLSSWDTSNVTSMSRIFQSCENLEYLNVGGKFGQNTGRVTDMSYMFCGLYTSGGPYDDDSVPNIGIQQITGLEQLDTHNVTNMAYMFNGDQLLTSLDVSNFNTENVTNMEAMFKYIYVSALNLNNFNTENVTNMKEMFSTDNLLNSLDLSSFDTRNVTDMTNMLGNTVVLTYDANKNIISIGLWQLILGENTILNSTAGLSTMITGSIIPPTIDLPTSGLWQELGSGTLPDAPYTTDSNDYAPNGQRLKSSSLMDGQSHEGIWVWAVNSIEIYGNLNDDWNINSDKAENWKPEDEIKSLINSDGSSMTAEQIQTAISNGELTVKYQTTSGEQVTEDSMRSVPRKYDVIYNWYGSPNFFYGGNRWYYKTFTCEVNVTDNIQRGIWGSAPWTFDDNSGILTFDGGGSLRSVDGGPWGQLPLAAGSVKHVDFATKVETDIDAQGLFRGTTGNGEPSCFSNVTSFDHMGNLDTSKSTTMDDMFGNDGALTSIDLDNFNTSNVISMTGMFARCGELNEIKNFNHLDTSRVIDMSNLFIGDDSLIILDITGMNTSNLVNIDSTFANIPNLKQIIGLNTWDTSKVTSMKNLFWNDQSLESIDVSNFNTSNVTDMSGMFSNDLSLLNLDLSNFNTHKVTTMNAMFYNDPVLTSIKGLNNPDFSTENVTDMSSMFANDDLLVDVDVSGFKTPKVTTIHNLFLNDKSLKTLTLGSGWTNDSLTDARAAFYGNSSLTTLDLSSFKLPVTVTQMWAMFNGTSNLKMLDLSGFDTRGISNPGNQDSNMENLFSGSGVNKLILGPNTVLNNADLPSANPSIYPVDAQGNRIGTYTGFDWQLVADGTDANPAGIKLSNTDLMDNQSHPGMWVWEQTTEKVKVAEIRYVDEQGNEIHSTDTLDIWPGSAVHYRATPYTDIIGYTLDDSKLPDNTDINVTNAQLDNPTQVITYVYAPNTENVKINYVDGQGKTLAPSDNLSGLFGEKYKTTPKVITGYHVYKVEGNITGTYSIENPEVTYVYALDAETAIVNYVDDAGNTISSAQVSGKFGDEVSTLTNIPSGYHYEKGAEAYTFTDGKEQSVNVTVAPNTEKVQDTATANETVTYEVADGIQAPTSKTYTAHFTRDGIKNLVTGEIIWEDWKSSDAAYDIKSPEVANQTPDQAEVRGTLMPNETHSDQVVYRANTEAVHDEATANETVTYEVADGATVPAKGTHTAHFTRDGIKNLVTGKIIWEDWKSSDAAYDIKSPEVANQTPDQAEVRGTLMPNETHSDQVVYRANTEAVHDEATANETVTYEVADGATVPAKGTHTAHFTRDGIKNLVTGKIIWEDWKSSDAAYDIKSPEVANQTPDQAEVRGTLMPNETHSDQVVYHANTEAVHDEATANETVTYEVADGATVPAKGTHTAHFTRDGIKNLVTGEIIWEDWKSSDAAYDIKSPEVANQTPDQAEVRGTLVPNETHGDQVVYRANLVTSTEYTTGRVTINYVDHQGNQVAPTNVQSCGFTRSVIKDDISGRIIETGVWTPTNEVDYSVITPLLVNRTADQMMVSGRLTPDENQTIMVSYADNVISVTDQTTGSITINYVDLNNHPVAPVKNIEVPFTRAGTKDLVTDQINWNPWESTSDINYQITSPEVLGMTTNQPRVNGHIQVNQHDVKQVVYTVVPVQPVVPTTQVQPEEPAKPSQPAVPVTPVQPEEPAKPSQPAVPTTPVQPEKPAEPAQTIVSDKAEQPTAVSAKPAAAPKQNALPQTGQDDNTSFMSITGTILLSLLGIFGINGFKKKKK